jgi:nitrogen fixation/metabolism regulation signal transduction histidine kinase
MITQDFRFRVGLRVVLLGLGVGLFMVLISRPNTLLAGGLVFLILAGQLVELFRFISITNRKLTRFLESVRYSDFISGFTADNRLGRSFKDLNLAFNEVLEAFRRARSEKEEHLQYLNTIVEQVRTGILSYDNDGKIQLINPNARRYLGLPNLRSIHDLKPANPVLYQCILDAATSRSVLYNAHPLLNLSIQSAELRIRGRNVRVVTLQNIQGELQKKELEAWQNLTRVLRHEIMNSITPISSLTSTLKDVLEHDLRKVDGRYELKPEGADDLKEGLDTIESRSKGLIRFIDAYREYTSLPAPVIRTVRIQQLFDRVTQLMKPVLAPSSIRFTASCDSEYLTIQADAELIEQVLINLLKNSAEALENTPEPMLQLRSVVRDQSVVIEVEDNGPGIIAQAIEKIFIPFYTTKRNGSGIGLALSRQIMQMHNGSLSAESEPGVSTVFRLRF